MLPDLTVADLLTLVGLTPVVMVFVELLKRTLAMTDAAVKRYGPVLSVGSGILLALTTSGWLTTQGRVVDLGQSVLTGFVAGALTAGLYDALGEQIGLVVERLSRGRVT